MSFNELPPEIIEDIFGYLDVRTFCGIKRVCKKWLMTTLNMEAAGHWKDFCFNHIPQAVLKEILSNQEIPSLRIYIDWLAVYKKWYNGRVPQCLDVDERAMILYFTEISEVKISGTFLITLDINGFISIWNYNTLRLLQTCRFHLDHVTCVVLLDLIQRSPYEIENMHWDHHHVVTGSKDRTVRIKSLLQPLQQTENDLVLADFDATVLKLRVCDDKLLVYSRDNVFTLYSLQMERGAVMQCSLLKKIRGPNARSRMKSISIWNDKITAIDYDVCLHSYNHEEDSWFEESYLNTRWSLYAEITKFFIFREQLIVLLSRNEVFISLGTEDYICFQTENVITCVAFKGTILAMGDSTGKLLLANVQSRDQILGFRGFDCTVQLHELPIFSIDIAFGTEYAIVAACILGAIHVVRCYSNSSVPNTMGRVERFNY